MREDWIEAPLIDVCEIHDNLRQPINAEERRSRIEGKFPTELFPYYGATGQVGWIDGFLSEGEYVLIGEDGAPFLDFAKNKAYLINGKTWVNNHAHILLSRFSNKYLLHFLNQFNFHGFVSGTTRLKLTQASLRKIPVKLAPLPEQRAIVSKIEQLFSELDNGIANLKIARDQLEVYRQAVLKKAFEGELTRENSNSYSTDNNDEIKIPLSWKWVLLGEISDMCLGKMLDKSKNKGTLQPYLGNINVRWGEFDLTDLKSMRFEEKEDERYGIVEGDLIVCEGGEPGRCAVWTISKPMKIQKALHRVRMRDNIDAKFVYHFFYYATTDGSLTDYFTGTTIKHLTGQKLKTVRIPLPPSLEEQKSIVAEIESRLSVCDKFTESIDESLDKAEALRQSILKKAFEGKLLSDAELEACRKEADWEPAEKLLARIEKSRNAGAEKTPATQKSSRPGRKKRE